MQKRLAVGLIFVTGAIITFLVSYFFFDKTGGIHKNICHFSATICLIGGLLLCLSTVEFGNYIFDPLLYKPNNDVPSLVYSMRLRALLFNNLSVIIFVFIILIIFIGFLFLVNPPIESIDKADNVTGPTVRIGSTVLLIFLVQVLFRVF